MRGVAATLSIAALVGTALADSPGAPAIIQRTHEAYANLKSYQFQLVKERRIVSPERESTTRTTLTMAWDHSGKCRAIEMSQLLTQAIQLVPDYRKAYENRAQAYAALKHWTHAIADYTAAIELGPARWQYEKRAEARRTIGDTKGADEDMRLAAAETQQ